MSRPDRRPVEPRGVLVRRRAALGLHIALQALVVVGSQGPWYQPTLSGKPVGDPVTGRDFVLHEDRPAPARSEQAVVTIGSGARAPVREQELDLTDEAPPREPGPSERAGFLATLALLGAIAAFFFTSYDLVAGRDLQLMPLLASLLVTWCAWTAFQQVRSSQSLLDDVLRGVNLAGGGEDPAAARLIPGLHMCWGAALFLAAAPQMLLVSLYLTFIAQRQPAE